MLNFAFLEKSLGIVSPLHFLYLLPFSQGRSSHYSDRLLDFSVTTPRWYKDIYVNNLFPCTAILLNSLPIEYFSLTLNLNGFKSTISRHLLIVVFFKRYFLFALIFLRFCFL